MASYLGVNGTMLAVEAFLRRRLPPELSGEPVNGRVQLLGSADVANPISGNTLGVYLHRITVDSHGRSRFFAPTSSGESPQPELGVNLHFLLIAAATSASVEADLMGWAIVQLANDSRLDVSHLADTDGTWDEREIITITPEEMSLEDLMRIWDVFEAQYTNTVPYVARTVRLRLQPQRTEGPAVVTRVFPTGDLKTGTDDD